MTVFRALEQRTATDGARPLLTWHHPSSGARVEFSAISFANWVDKTINLLADLGWGCSAGDDDFTVSAPLLASRPAHWVSAVWAMTSWQSGGRLRVEGQPGSAEVVVLGPDAPAAVAGADTIACSLHPLGLGLPTAIDAVIDYREVLSQPDLHTPSTAVPERDWIEDAVLPQLDPISGRIMLAPADWTTMLATLSAVIIGGGSLVLLDGDVAAAEVAEIASSEKAEILG